MERSKIALDRIKVMPFTFLEKDWCLLGAGDYQTKKINAMTIAWGSVGTMWKKPFVMVVVRPTRHTFQLMEKYPTFTLSSFPPSCRASLEYMGAHTGKTEDKITNAKLNAEASRTVAAPSFQEASLVLECSKMYHHDFDPALFKAPFIAELYNKDYHRMYFGEVVDATASKEFIASCG